VVWEGWRNRYKAEFGAGLWFCQRVQLGLEGDAEGVVARGLRYFLSRYRRADGLYRTLVAGDGRPLR